MNKDNKDIPSALQFIREQDFKDSSWYYSEYGVAQALIDFAQMHVEAALKKASEEATIQGKHPDGDLVLKKIHTKGGRMYTVNYDSILNAYPKEKIK